jgi:hypothetical protein
MIWDGATHYGLATVNADGSGYRLITRFEDNDESASWSPDGAVLAFDGFESGVQRVWAMNADGSGRRQLIFETTPTFMPVWNPKARPAGPLTGGDSQRASLQRPPSSKINRDEQRAPTARSSVCRALRDGASVRFSCPFSP